MMIVFRSSLSLLALVYQSVILALSQVWSNKARAFLTMLGIMIGVGAVTAVIAALTGMKSYVLNEFESFGANKLYIIPDRPETGPMSNVSWRQIRITPEQLNGWETQCPSISALTRYQDFGASVQANGINIDDGRVSAIEPAWHDIENRKITIGRKFIDLDQIDARQVCLISERLRDKLRLDRDCTGESVLINDRRFIVVGVLEDQPEGGMMRDSSSQNVVFIPFSTGWRIQEGFMYAIATAKSPEAADDARAEMTVFLRRKRSLKPQDPNTFRIEVMQRFIEQFKSMSSVLTSIAVGIVAVSLLVGGVGIMNIMLVSVSERTREIGLRKAVGALPSAVMLQFLVEAVMLCCIGGLFGLVIGQALTIALQNIPGVNFSQAYIPTWAVILAFGFSGSVGVLFGMFPAIKAALLDPIEALRHD